VLYEILSGREMFVGDKVNELLNQAKNVKPPPPSEIAKDREIPQQLEDLCMQCIEKNPDDRIQTARTLVSKLRSWRLRWAAQSD
jgi:serine/threonine protein kinase